MKYTEEHLSALASKAVHAIENEQNIYHEQALMGVELLTFVFKKSKLEVLNKIKEYIKE